VFNGIGMRRIRHWEQKDWYRYYCDHHTPQALAWDAVKHIVIIPNYKEPMPVLRRTLDCLAAQYEARLRLIIVLAMEAGETNSVEKAEMLQAEYAGKFRHIFYTVHPRGIPGEMQCKSANESWAARWIKRRVVDELGYDMDALCVTTMDADTRWHSQFFFALTCHFALNTERHLHFWQAPIRYHGNIWDINPLLRIVNAYANAMELAYLASPWWKPMPMSSYSLSLRLLDTSGYWDGDVIADEWHMFIKAYFARDGQVKLQPIFLPFLADATIGENLWGELRERYEQTLRHAWGSKEVGYMIAKMIDNPHVDFRSAFRLLVRIAHDILLAGAGWVIITVGSQLPIILHPEVVPFNPVDVIQSIDDPALVQSAAESLTSSPAWLLITIALLLVAIAGVIFWIQDVAVRPPRIKRMTLMELIWTVLSLPLLSMLTLFLVALPTIQAQTRLLLGIPLQFRVSKKV
jgi:hypothetical protein